MRTIKIQALFIKEIKIRLGTKGFKDTKQTNILFECKEDLMYPI